MPSSSPQIQAKASKLLTILEFKKPDHHPPALLNSFLRPFHWAQTEPCLANKFATIVDNFTLGRPLHPLTDTQY